MFAGQRHADIINISFREKLIGLMGAVLSGELNFDHS